MLRASLHPEGAGDGGRWGWGANGSSLGRRRVRKLLGRTAARIGAAFGGAPTWSAEDYSAPFTPTVEPQDHWAAPTNAPPQPEAEWPSEGVPTAAPLQLPLSPLGDLGPQAELPFADPSAAEPPLVASAFDWFADEPNASPDDRSAAFEREHGFEDDLPGFDPDATTARPAETVFDRPHAFRVDTKAGLLARETDIPDREGRERAARVFAEALEEGRWPGLFNSWKRLAPSIGCPRVLALVFELRELWEDSPHLWRFRTAPRRPTSWHESARGHFSWRRAIAIARADPEAPAWAALDDDLLSEWEELADPCPGFWSVAEYAELRATGDEAEAELFAILARDGRERRALHLQDGCGHLDWRRSGPTARVSSALETGTPARARLVDAYDDADDEVDEDESAQESSPGVRYG